MNVNIILSGKEPFADNNFTNNSSKMIYHAKLYPYQLGNKRKTGDEL